ncbi:small integral membrane protein 11A isoform X1 [Ursus maritimus]|uniref:Small integral membrane protein 11A isoform X1 n=1 Tax=Ursus maritimus TaxID=29073 RepID=A0A8M1F0I7_URSMA|nr:small integral membrane protein 11A isoform X1 [Ursus maritimus]
MRCISGRVVSPPHCGSCGSCAVPVLEPWRPGVVDGTKAPRGKSLTSVRTFFLQSASLLTLGQRNRTALPAPLLICLSEWACVDPEGIRHWPNMNWKVLEHVPLLLYILAAKTLILCLAFAGVKIYQRKRLEAKQQKLEAEKKTQSEKKEN